MDDEDGPHSADAHSGWIGATYQDINTTFEFCRVNGDLFTDVNAGPFAVLQLSDTCPKGGQSYGRLFENERDDFFGNNNHYSTSQNKGLFPNWQDDHFTYLEFCYFKNPLQNGLLPGQWFPDFGIEYGVFASPSDLHDAPAYGELLTDDEDGSIFQSNEDDLYPVFPSAMQNIILANGNNTEMHFAKVRPFCVPQAALRINGVSAGFVSIIGPKWPIVIDGSQSTCSDGAYFVSIQLSDAHGGHNSIEEMRWLTLADYAAYGNILQFDMRRFAQDRYFIFVPGQYYWIKLAVGPRWSEAVTLIYIRPQPVDWRRRAVVPGPLEP